MKPLSLLTIFLILGNFAQAQPPANSSAQNVVVIRISNPPKISMPLKVQQSLVAEQHPECKVTRTIEKQLLTSILNSITLPHCPATKSRNTIEMSEVVAGKIFIYTHSES